MSEIERYEKPVEQGKYRKSIPDAHMASADTKLRWLWNQRFGTLQRIWQETDDGETKMAATLLLNAAYGGDIPSIGILFNRLEGGAMQDTELLDFSEDPMPI